MTNRYLIGLLYLFERFQEVPTHTDDPPNALSIISDDSPIHPTETIMENQIRGGTVLKED
ncbi:MAG: hypothetical protein NPIRA05_15980 [Nitrospirales bacterium]|nr:MAG: hypothetical protein NPIRA05_15980 [Nitrospirales bacterium]